MSCENINYWYMNQAPTGTLPPASLTILLLGDGWGDARGGISAVNTTLALALTGISRVAVVCTTLDELGEICPAAVENARERGVKLVSLADKRSPWAEMPRPQMYSELDLADHEPLAFLGASVEWATHIVGHFPITANFAVAARREVYPESKVILFLHIIPSELEWLRNRLPYVLPPTNQDVVELAKLADVVYSVTPRVHRFYKSFFENVAHVCLDHRLYVPQSPPEVFAIEPRWRAEAPRVLVIQGDECADEWHGTDIIIEALRKVEAELTRAAAAKLAADNQLEAAVEAKRLQADRFKRCRDIKKSTYVDACSPDKKAKVEGEDVSLLPLEGVNAPVLTVSKAISLGAIVQCAPVGAYDGTPNLEQVTFSAPDNLMSDLEECSLCVVPARAEPFGVMGLQAVSAGMPTLVSDRSGLASILEGLMPNASKIIVKTTSDASAARQDAAVWAARILALLRDPEGPVERARALKEELRRDDLSKDTLDNFVAFCTGGINVQLLLDDIEYIPRSPFKSNEMLTRQCFNAFMLAALKHSWRVKRHPLIDELNAPETIAHFHIPVRAIIKDVIGLVEEHQRRIVAFNDRAMYVYCPRRADLQDLWARSMRVAMAMQEILCYDDDFQALCRHGLARATIRALILGPDFLAYNKRQVEIERFKNIWVKSHYEATFSINQFDDDECDT